MAGMVEKMEEKEHPQWKPLWHQGDTFRASFLLPECPCCFIMGDVIQNFMCWQHKSRNDNCDGPRESHAWYMNPRGGSNLGQLG